MPAADKFLVIVHSAPPEGLGSTYHMSQNQPTVKTVRARGPKEAANVAGVKPGGYALVVPYEHVVRFDRAMTAPLTERSLV